MAGEQEDLLVKIEEEEAPPSPVQNVQNPEQTVDESRTEPKPDPVAELQAQYDELQQREAKRAEELEAVRAREEQTRRVNESLRREQTQAQTQLIDAQLEGVVNSLQAAETEVTSAEAEYAAAMERADYAAAAKAQRRMASAEYRINQYGQAKEYWETQKKAPPPPPRQASNDADSFIDRLTGPSRDWAMAHRDYISDPAKRRKMELAHAHAIGEELTPDTPEYFAHIETRLGLREAKEPPKQQQRRAAPPAAPVGSGGNGFSGQGEPVVLTKREAASATDGTIVWNYDDTSPQKRFKKGQPIGIQEMARRKREMMKQGLYDKMYTEI